MRHLSLVAVHRGGTLSPADHRLLAVWAAGCAERVLPLCDQADSRPAVAVRAARAWAEGAASAGTARSAAVEAHAAARDARDPAARLAARSAGHAAAVAHMADHELGAAFYALLALEASGAPDPRLDEERAWQRAALPEQVADLVLADMARRAAKFQHVLDRRGGGDGGPG